MCFEVVNCHFRRIASVETWWYKFKGKVVLVPDVFLHVFRDFIVNHMFFGDTPVHCRRLTNAPQARIILPSFQLVMGSSSIAQLSISTITMTYLLPCSEQVGNCPVWSKMVSQTLQTVVQMSCTFLPCKGVTLACLIGAVLCLVEHTFLHVWLRWPYMLLSVLGQYFAMFFLVTSGHPTKLPAQMALSQVDLWGNHNQRSCSVWLV